MPFNNLFKKGWLVVIMDPQGKNVKTDLYHYAVYSDRKKALKLMKHPIKVKLEF